MKKLHFLAAIVIATFASPQVNAQVMHTVGNVQLEALPTSSTAPNVITADALGNLFYRSTSSLFPTSLAWDLAGNNLLTGTEWLGTNNNFPLNIKTNNTDRAIITATGEMGIGTMTPTSLLEVTTTSPNAPAIKGNGKSVGVYGEATDMNSALTELGIVNGWSEAIGVFGKGNYASLTGNGNIYGVVGSSSLANPLNNVGVFGEAKNATGYNTGVYGSVEHNTGIYNMGVAGKVTLNATATWSRAIAGFAPVAPNHFAGYFEGKVAIVDGTQANNYVLTSDANGLATWTDPCSLPCVAAASASNWHLSGNAATIDGTDFIGTTDNVPFNIRVNNMKAGRIESNGATANTFFGFESGNVNTIGANNSANGFGALSHNTSGSLNTATGSLALYKNISGEGNTAVGMWANWENTMGNDNTAIGRGTLNNNTTGSGNTAIGYAAINGNLNGNYNTAVGYLALYNNNGSNNTALGYQADVTIAGLTNATAIGYNAKVAASNSLVLGGTGADAVMVGIGTTNPTEKLDVQNGSVRIGNVTTPVGYKLYVEQGILTEKVMVALAGSTSWADYVFANDYKLKSLSEVEAFIKENKHLPNVPSAEELQKEGIDLGKMQAKQMEKIEELTLYLIEMKKEIEVLKGQNAVLKAKN